MLVLNKKERTETETNDTSAESFDLAPWMWMWHYHEAATPSCPRITFFTPRWPTLIAARGLGALLIKPRPLLGCQIKADIKGFLLRYRLFLFLYVPFCSVQALVPSKFLTKDFPGIHFYTLYLNLCVNNIENCHLQSLCSRYLVHTKNDRKEAMEDLKIWKGGGASKFLHPINKDKPFQQQ